MNEDIKKEELKEEELESVSGGSFRRITADNGTQFQVTNYRFAGSMQNQAYSNSNMDEFGHEVVDNMF